MSTDGQEKYLNDKLQARERKEIYSLQTQGEKKVK